MKGRPFALSPEQVADLIEDYKTHSSEECAAMYGVTRYCITHTLRRAGVTRRNRGYCQELAEKRARESR